MKQKKWTNCPSCGSKESMVLKKNIHQEFFSQNYPNIKIGPLSGYFCKVCKEGIFTIQSMNFLNAKLTEHKAKHDAKTTVIADVMPVSEASKLLKITRQAIQNLMKKGKIAYVFFGQIRLPKRQAVLKYIQEK